MKRIRHQTGIRRADELGVSRIEQRLAVEQRIGRRHAVPSLGVELLIHGAQVDIRQQGGHSAPVERRADARNHRRSKEAGRKHLGPIVVGLHRQADLLEIVFALRAASGLASLLNGRQEQGNQDGDDRDHHQQLDEREPALQLRPVSSV